MGYTVCAQFSVSRDVIRTIGRLEEKSADSIRTVNKWFSLVVFVHLFTLKMSSVNQPSVYRFASGGRFGIEIHKPAPQFGLSANRTAQGIWACSAVVSPAGMPRFRVSYFSIVKRNE